jgi:hypothetical protein
MSALEDLVHAAMTASPDRQEEALRLLRGQLPKPEPYLSLRELARRIGYSVTTLRRWLVPGHRLGGHQRYRLTEVETYLKTEEFQRRLAALRAERTLSAAVGRSRSATPAPQPKKGKRMALLQEPTKQPLPTSSRL